YLMQRSKTPALTFRELIPFLENLVAKFGYESGIEARFVSDTEAPPLPARACHEVARIVQEALVNVRKHTRATHVDVAVSSDHEGLKLMIEDDGPESGLGAWCYEDNKNEERNKTSWEPAVIRERVLLLKGTLLIEPRLGSGVRLVIKIPISEHSHWWVHDRTIESESRSIPR